MPYILLIGRNYEYYHTDVLINDCGGTGGGGTGDPTPDPDPDPDPEENCDREGEFFFTLIVSTIPYGNIEFPRYELNPNDQWKVGLAAKN